jgi:hypothetical protein
MIDWGETGVALPTFKFCILLLCGLIGCDQSQPSTPSKPAASASVPPAATPVTSPTTIASAATAPATAFMMIDQQRVDFPPAKLRISDSDGRVVALLHSDDPRDAISDRYTGNSFYFEMALDAPTPAEFVSSVWHFTAPTIDRGETPFGVFLDGHRRQLQPLDVSIEFDATDDPTNTTVWITGRFLHVHVQDSAQPASTVSVAARLTARTSLK